MEIAEKILGFFEQLEEGAKGASESASASAAETVSANNAATASAQAQAAAFTEAASALSAAAQEQSAAASQLTAALAPVGASYDTAATSATAAGGAIDAAAAEVTGAATEITGASTEQAAAFQAAADAATAASAQIVTAEETASGAASTSAEETTAANTEKEASTGSLVGTVGKLGLATTAGLAVASVAALKFGVDWQDTMTTLSNQAHIPEDSADKIGSAMQSLSGKVKFNQTDLANSLSSVAGQWEQYTGHALDAKSATDLMSTAAKLAQGSGQDLNSTTTGLVQTMIAFHEPVSQASTVTNELYNVSRVTGSSIGQFSNAADMMRARLGAASPSLTDISTLMDDLGSHGLTGTRAVQGMQTAFNNMIAPSTAIQKQFQSIGVNLYDSHGKFIGLTAAIGELHTAFQKLTPEQQTHAAMTIAGTGAMGQFLHLVQSGVPGLDKYKNAVTQSGTVQDAYAKSQKDVGVQMDEMKNKVEVLATQFGSVLVGGILKVENVAGPYVKMVADLVEKHQSLKEILKIAAVAITAIAVAFGVYTVATKVAAASTAIFNAVMDANPIMLVVIAIVALVAGIVELIKHWDQVSAAAKAAFDAVKTVVVKAFDDVKTAVMDGVNAVLNFLKAHWQLIVSIIGGPIAALVVAIATHWAEIKAGAETAWNDIKGFFTSTWAAITGVFTGAISSVEGALTGAWSAIQSALKTAWDAVKGVFTSTWAAIEGVVTGAVSTVESALTGAWSAIQSALQTAWDTVKNTIQTAWTNIETAIQTAISTVEGALTTAWQTVLSDVQSAWANILAFLQGIPSKMETAATNLMTGFENGLTGALGDVLSFFSGLGGKIISAFGDAKSMLLQVGRDVMNGLKNGIIDGLKDVLAAAENAAKSVKSHVMSVFGIRSPSQVMADQVGKPIMQGITKGIQDNQQETQDTLTTSLDTMLTTTQSYQQLFTAAFATGEGQRGADMTSALAKMQDQFQQYVTANQSALQDGDSQQLSTVTQMLDQMGNLYAQAGDTSASSYITQLVQGIKDGQAQVTQAAAATAAAAASAGGGAGGNGYPAAAWTSGVVTAAVAAQAAQSPFQSAANVLGFDPTNAANGYLTWASGVPFTSSDYSTYSGKIQSLLASGQLVSTSGAGVTQSGMLGAINAGVGGYITDQVDSHGNVTGQTVYGGQEGAGIQLPSYSVGTPYVPRTGPYILHQAEGVLTPEENAAYQANRGQGGNVININISGNVDDRAIQQIKDVFENVIKPHELGFGALQHGVLA